MSSENGVFFASENGVFIESENNARAGEVVALPAFSVSAVWHSNIFTKSPDPRNRRHTYILWQNESGTFIFATKREWLQRPTAAGFPALYDAQVRYLEDLTPSTTRADDESDGATFTEYTWSAFLATTPWSPGNRNLYPVLANPASNIGKFFRCWTIYAQQSTGVVPETMLVNWANEGALSQDRISSRPNAEGIDPGNRFMDDRSTIWDESIPGYDSYRIHCQVSRGTLGSWSAPPVSTIDLVGGGTASTTGLHYQTVTGSPGNLITRVTAFDDFVVTGPLAPGEKVIECYDVDQSAAHSGLFAELAPGYYWSKTDLTGNEHKLYIPDTVTPTWIETYPETAGFW